MEIVKRPHVENFIAWAKERPEVVVLSADLTNSCEVGPWRDTYPDRFFSMGMAEQNMMGVAAGLAREGYTPFIHTFAVFIYRRAYDQLAMSIAYPNLRVRFFGFLPGIVTPGGVTHQAIEDIAIMRATPNMTVLETGDATEVESVLDVAQAVDGPCYVRFLRGEMPRLFPKSEPFALNKARTLSEGDDVVILTAGITTEEAMRAADFLNRKGVGVRHLHVSTHKPFTDPAVLDALKSCRYGAVTLENHITTGGLGTAVSELMTDHGVGKRLIRLGLNDTYAHGASRDYLQAEYNLDAKALVKAVGELTGAGFEASDADINAARAESGASDAKAEAL
ncbi:MAG: transketolase C-terminal domain-containing protein [Pseudomonadota bacterium]